jgi:hypothetical protein
VWKRVLQVVENLNFEIQQSVLKRGFGVVKSIKLTRGVKDFFQSFLSFEKNVCRHISVQNVFFSNGVFESHQEVQGPITTKKRPRLLHCFVNISRMPNLHTFNIVIM